MPKPFGSMNPRVHVHAAPRDVERGQSGRDTSRRVQRLVMMPGSSFVVSIPIVVVVMMMVVMVVVMRSRTVLENRGFV